LHQAPTPPPPQTPNPSPSNQDPSLNPDALAAAARLYAGGRYSLDDPRISPAFADYGTARRAAAGGRFPPVLITVGTREVLLSDAVLLRHKMREGGVDATISPYEGMVSGGAGVLRVFKGCWGQHGLGLGLDCKLLA